MQPSKVEIVGPATARPAGLEHIVSHRDLKRASDPGSKFILKLKHITKGPVVRIRPEMHTVTCANQLRRYPHAICRAADTTFEDVGGTKLLPDRPQVVVSPL